MVHTSLISKHILSTNLNLHDKPMNHTKSEASLNKKENIVFNGNGWLFPSNENSATGFFTQVWLQSTTWSFCIKKKKLQQLLMFCHLSTTQLLYDTYMSKQPLKFKNFPSTYVFLLSIEGGSSRSHYVDDSFWKRLWTCRLTDYWWWWWYVFHRSLFHWSSHTLWSLWDKSHKIFTDCSGQSHVIHTLILTE